MSYPRLICDRCSHIARLVAGARVLDIGCVEHNLTNRKHGRWLHNHLVQAAAYAPGLDYGEEQVKRMNEEGFNAIAADATDFSLNETLT